jgi:hypothetical protein
MRAGEWSRSRFWLSHFISSRHRRAVVAWCSPRGVEDRRTHNALTWLGAITARTGLARAWVVRRAAVRYAADPACVQCLRLIIREQQHHRELVARLHARFDVPATPASVPGRDAAQPLGVRFRMSLQLMSDLADTAMLEQLTAAVDGDGDGAMRAVCGTLLRERQMHISFLGERLADEFADFNFARRNLRRWRLRLMFAALLPVRLVEQRGLLRALGVSPIAHADATWQHFSRMLECVVPYRRDALLRLLTTQRERPYDRPS